MPTTLIGCSAPIGIGNMALELSKNLDEIDEVILIDYEWYDQNKYLEFPSRKVINRSNYKRSGKNLGNFLKLKSAEVERKFLFIETTWGLAKYLNPKSCYLIPMWEQDSITAESKLCDNIISITKYGLKLMSSLNLQPRYIPFPIEMQKQRPRKEIKTILHNAGSFGGDFRKGTPEAIEIFQKSGLSENGVSLIVTSLLDPDSSLIDIYSKDPRNITFSVGVRNSWKDIYGGADLLLYPSRIEGHALPVLEAHSFGIPALCTNVAPINEYESDSNYLLDSKPSGLGKRVTVNIDEAAKKLANLITSDFEKKSHEVFESSKLIYSWDALKPFWSAILK